MARVFITGSSAGLGLLAAKRLLAEGHRVVLHARNDDKALRTQADAPGAETVLVADLSKLEEVKKLAAAVNALGRFDAIIHNAGVYRVPGTEILAVNTIAPYVLTCLIERPQRLVYLSSSSHLGGRPVIEKIRKCGSISYGDSKLHDLMLAKAIARRWRDVRSNALDPGWVPTRMGGKGAPDDLAKGAETQVWLAVSNDARATVTGRYFYHRKEAEYLPVADHESLQEALLAACAEVAGVTLQ